MVWVFAFIRIVSNPFSNVFQKALTRRAADPLFIICVTHGLLTIACLPLILPDLIGPKSGFWLNISICALLAVAGNSLLVQAVRLSDLSVLGPINAYKSVVSLLPGIILLGEVPRPAGLTGIGLIVAGSYFVVDRDVNQPRRNVFVRFFRDRGIQYRLAALVLSATEAVFLKKALLASTPVFAFAWWAVLGFAFSLIGVAGLIGGGNRLRHERVVLRANLSAYLMLALTTGLMQLTTLLTFAVLNVGYSLALFQTSTLLTVILGSWFFHEPHFGRRMLGSAVMVAGAALIIVSK
jgi:drug/metabolite transporter (DMT)-like permease